MEDTPLVKDFYLDRFEYFFFYCLQIGLGLAMGFYLQADLLYLLFLLMFIYLRIRTHPEIHLPAYKKASIFVLHTTVFSMMGLLVNVLYVIFTGQAIGYRGSTSAVENEAEFEVEDEDLIPEEAQKNLGPELVTPAAMFLVSEGAPNGVIMQAQGGQYSIACIVENEGVALGADADADDVASSYERIADLTGAKPRGMLQLDAM